MPEQYHPLELVESSPPYFPEFVEAIPDGYSIKRHKVSIEHDPSDTFNELYGEGNWLLYLHEPSGETDKSADLEFGLIVKTYTQPDRRGPLKGTRITHNGSLLKLIQEGKK